MKAPGPTARSIRSSVGPQVRKENNVRQCFVSRKDQSLGKFAVCGHYKPCGRLLEALTHVILYVRQ